MTICNKLTYQPSSTPLDMLIDCVKPWGYLQNMVQLDCQYLTKRSTCIGWAWEHYWSRGRIANASLITQPLVFRRETFPFVVRRIAWPKFN